MRRDKVDCIVLVRPVGDDDPCLVRTRDGALFPRLLAGLSRLPEIGRIFLSAPESVPEPQRRQLDGLGPEVRYSAREFPQHRALEIMEDLGLSRALLLTSYSWLLDAGEIAALRRLGDGADMAASADSLAMDHLVLASRRGLEALASACPDTPVTPLYFHEFAARFAPSLEVRLLERPLGRARRFVTELLLDASRGLLPKDILTEHFGRTPQADWFRREAHDRLLLDMAGAEGFEEMDRALQAVDETFRVYVAKQVRFMRKLRPLVPPGRRFLELGFGMSLLSSFCLLDRFEGGAAVEPYLLRREYLDYSRNLYDCLSRHYPGTLPEGVQAGAGEPGGGRLDVHLGPVEEAGLAAGSLDFCFSHVVFEHVKPVEAVSRELHRLLRPGGVMLHEIGLMDHTRNSNNIEFEFLRHSREEWAALDQDTNLWRVNDFVDLWTRLGFSVDVVERHVRRVPPASLHPSWGGYADEDLYCYKALVRAVRN